MSPRRPRRAGTDIRLRRRVAFASAITLLAGGTLVYRLVDLQVLNPDRYVDHGEAQRIRVAAIPAGRGGIVDRNGNDLVLSVPAPSVVADPRLVEDPWATAQALTAVLGGDPSALAARLGGDGRFTYVARHVDPAVAEAVTALGLAGVRTVEEPERTHPGGSAVAAAILGRTDGWEVGATGLEHQYDDVLTGTPGERVVEMGPGGYTIPTGEHRIDPAVPGETLVLTLDRTLQYEAERVLADAIRRTGAQGGVLLAADPRTGDILADANMVVGADGEVRAGTEHRAVTWAFEPGSVMKPITFAGVFEEGLATPSTRREVPDRFTRYDATFKDDRPHAVSSWDVSAILAESSNVGTLLWAEALADEGLHRWVRAFGFGAVTGLGFPGEASGIVPPVERWSGVSRDTISFGHGVAVTPIQLLAAYATIANGGVRVEPRLVLGTRRSDGGFRPVGDPAGTRIVSEQTAGWLTESLTSVVREGTGQRAGVPGITVAGKTGTAWKAQRSDGWNAESDQAEGYGRGSGVRYLASFAGFLPADDPRLVAVVVLDEPTGESYSGGRAAAPAFSEFAGFAARQLRMTGTDAVVATEGTRVRVRPQPVPDGSGGSAAAAAAPGTTVTG
jgi:cell division protein FtsI (penicillin-binding protein 3)